MSGGFETLAERGFVSQCSDTDALRTLLGREAVPFYVGFDPTGSSLHVGHLVPLFAMAHLQRAGHCPICLVGGGTARIGDPSGKTETRKMLSIEEIGRNAERFKLQFSRFLDFSDGGAMMLDNSEWLAGLNYIDFLRDIGKHFSVNRMLSFEAYKSRLETGLSFIEFNYQLLQSYDYLVLHRKHGCLLQMGGDDQWGNIISGMELIRRVDGGDVFALTSPLVTRSDGKKMGKTEKGALFLDPELVSPYEFYQYWVNVPDEDAGKLLLLLTFVATDEARRLGALGGSESREAKSTLAYELTSIVHGESEARAAQEASRAAFGGPDSASGAEGSPDLSGVPSMEVPAARFGQGISVAGLFVETRLCASTSEARRLVAQGGAYVNGSKVDSYDSSIGEEDVRDGVVLLRAGKKRHFRVVVV